jgi:hypothetical protein
MLPAFNIFELVLPCFSSRQFFFLYCHLFEQSVPVSANISITQFESVDVTFLLLLWLSFLFKSWCFVMRQTALIS